MGVTAGMKAFIRIWLGQTISVFGSGLTTFALSVWVYRSTGSITQFAMVSFFSSLPGLLAAIVAGPIVDRFNRTRVIVFSDMAAGLGALAIALLPGMNSMKLPFIYALVAVISICTSFRWPAYLASVTMLIPPMHFRRANGMVQISEALARIGPPALAGFLIGIMALRNLLLIDCATYVVAIFLTLTVTVKQGSSAGPIRKKLFSEALEGWRYLYARAGLWGLLVYFAIMNFFFALATVLATPMVLGFASVSALGLVVSLSGIGMLLGAIVSSTWTGFKSRVHTVFLFGLLSGIGVIIFGARPSISLVEAGAFIAFFCFPMINANSQAIWQSKVPESLQGRVFSIRRMVATVSPPLAYVLSGPLVVYLFAPLYAGQGVLARMLRGMMGERHGGEIGLLEVLVGLLIIIVSLFMFLQKHVRYLEKEVEDVLPQPVPEEMASAVETV